MNSFLPTPKEYDRRWFHQIPNKPCPKESPDSAASYAWNSNRILASQLQDDDIEVVNAIKDLNSAERAMLLSKIIIIFDQAMFNTDRAIIIRAVRSIPTKDQQQFINLIKFLMPFNINYHSQIVLLTTLLANAAEQKTIEELTIFCNKVKMLQSAQTSAVEFLGMLEICLKKSDEELQNLVTAKLQNVLNGLEFQTSKDTSPLKVTRNQF